MMGGSRVVIFLVPFAIQSESQSRLQPAQEQQPQVQEQPGPQREQLPPPVCSLCKTTCTTWAESLLHNWTAHQRLEVVPQPLAKRLKGPAAIFPCMVCGLGSGVVFASRNMLCQHLLEHLYCTELTVPEGSLLALAHAEQSQADPQAAVATAASATLAADPAATAATTAECAPASGGETVAEAGDLNNNDRRDQQHGHGENNSAEVDGAAAKRKKGGDSDEALASLEVGKSLTSSHDR